MFCGRLNFGSKANIKTQPHFYAREMGYLKGNHLLKTEIEKALAALR